MQLSLNVYGRPDCCCNFYSYFIIFSSTHVPNCVYRFLFMIVVGFFFPCCSFFVLLCSKLPSFSFLFSLLFIAVRYWVFAISVPVSTVQLGAVCTPTTRCTAGLIVNHCKKSTRIACLLTGWFLGRTSWPEKQIMNGLWSCSASCQRSQRPVDTTESLV